jgi:transcription initiation factor TFIID TATA-box-binding protein
MLLFVSGKIVFTGAKSKEQIYQAFDLIKPVLYKFKKIEYVPKDK